MENGRINGYMLNEQELIDGCRKGSRGFQEALYERYSRKMMVVCLRYSKSTAEAEDILQEGFVKVFNALKDFRQESKLETWITRIMVNTALNSQRKKLYLYPMVDVEKIDVPEDEGKSITPDFKFDVVVIQRINSRKLLVRTLDPMDVFLIGNDLKLVKGA